jgi:hypothetical protein
VKVDGRGMECSAHEEKRNVCWVLVMKREGKRRLGILNVGCEDNIKMVLREIGWGGMDWIDLAQDRGQ